MPFKKYVKRPLQKKRKTTMLDNFAGGRENEMAFFVLLYLFELEYKDEELTAHYFSCYIMRKVMFHRPMQSSLVEKYIK